jgi:virginiamycin B lyase
MIGGAPAPQIPDRELPMSRRFIALRAAIAAVAAWLFMSAGPVAAQAPALSGKIASDREGPMEGVLVSAKKPGGTITVTVVSDAKGDYAFPADRLELGRYELMIRAAGYALDGSGALELAPGKTAKADLRLKPAAITTDQLTNSEWMTSVPGPEDLKRAMLNCADCHSLHRIFESKHTAADFLKVFERMGGYYPGASDMQPQRLTGEHRRPAVNPAIAQRLADYLASVNLSSQSRHEFELKSWPRAARNATRVITNDYDLPRKEIQPHDVIVDPEGMVWYSHFGEQFLSKLDPKTGKVTDFPIPVQKPNHPKGTLDLEIDADGHLWIGLMYQTGMARFDRGTETFRIFPVPSAWQTDATQQSHFSVAGMKVDGKAWVKNTDRSQVMRLDPQTGEYENLGTFRNPANDRPIGIYGIYADQQNNAYILEFPFGGIGKIDAKTGKLAFYPTPTPNARARRGRVDTQNRLWFAEYGANGVGMFDPKTETITEWKKPLQWEAPYDVVADRNGEAWEINTFSDRVGRLDPKSGEWTNYLLPRYSNIRRVFIDDRKTPVTMWIGNNLGAAVIKLEPLD